MTVGVALPTGVAVISFVGAGVSVGVIDAVIDGVTELVGVEVGDGKGVDVGASMIVTGKQMI